MNETDFTQAELRFLCSNPASLKALADWNTEQGRIMHERQFTGAAARHLRRAQLLQRLVDTQTARVKT